MKFSCGALKSITIKLHKFFIKNTKSKSLIFARSCKFRLHIRKSKAILDLCKR